MPLDEPLLVQALLALTAATVVLCVVLLLVSTRHERTSAKEGKPVAINWAKCWLAEAIGTFALLFIGVLSLSGAAIGGAPARLAHLASIRLAIGLTMSLGILAIGPITGAAMNPARAFAPALAVDHWANQLVYWVGPMVGGGLAALMHHFFFMEQSATIRLAEATVERRPAER